MRLAGRPAVRATGRAYGENPGKDVSIRVAGSDPSPIIRLIGGSARPRDRIERAVSRRQEPHRAACLDSCV